MEQPAPDLIISPALEEFHAGLGQYLHKRSSNTNHHYHHHYIIYHPSHHLSSRTLSRAVHSPTIIIVLEITDDIPNSMHCQLIYTNCCFLFLFLSLFWLDVFISFSARTPCNTLLEAFWVSRRLIVRMRSKNLSLAITVCHHSSVGKPLDAKQ